MQEACAKIKELEAKFQETKSPGTSTSKKEKSSMEHNASARIDKFKEGYGKLNIYGEQVENIVKL